jgi:AraC-like DNA-binding protein
MRYLAPWRLQLAADLLRDQSRLGMAAIAGRVGYESEAAFSRTFKRRVGVFPAAWRKRAVRGARLRVGQAPKKGGKSPERRVDIGFRASAAARSPGQAAIAPGELRGPH